MFDITDDAILKVLNDYYRAFFQKNIDIPQEFREELLSMARNHMSCIYNGAGGQSQITKTQLEELDLATCGYLAVMMGLKSKWGDYERESSAGELFAFVFELDIERGESYSIVERLCQLMGISIV